jgi:DNA repair photolyase
MRTSPASFGPTAVDSPSLEIAGLIEPNPVCGTIAINPYRGCDIRCVYCITGSQGRSVPRASAEATRAALRRRFAAAAPADTFVLGGLSDAYPSVDATEQRARLVVEELVRLGRRYFVVTKSTLVAREAALFATSPCRVSMSLCSVDDDELAQLDPGAETHNPRLEALRIVAEAGVEVAVNVMPWIPGVTDVPAIVAEVRRIVGPEAWVIVSPLNVRAPKVARTRFGRAWEQRSINDAYRREWQRVAPQRRVNWLAEPPLEGEHGNRLAVAQ